ncbi:MAG: hypothetical protein BroJett040_09600 [Oligoflexia bacterium]|nr:MAG: hypothetical protein BroJett040_09600 [Oligoflexia bacterium]
MKKVGDIMAEMGFRKEASDSLKEAFVRHLIKAATGVEVSPGPNERKTRPTSRPGDQLSFDLSDEETGKKTG